MKRRSYYRRLVQLFLSYKRKETELSYLPVRLWIEPTSVCNLQCIMCPNKDLKKEEKGFMNFELFKKTIDEASRFVFDIHLLHRGESLLHPDFFKMARYSHDAGIVTRFHTNGTLLDEEKSYKLIESGIDQFAFSFDGYDKETYERVRFRGNFDQTVGNIVKFLEIKKSLPSKKPMTVIELINFPELYKGVDRLKKKEFLKNFKGLPLDKIEVKEIHNWAGEVGEVRRGKKYSICTFPWQAMIIFWDGTVVPCTQDYHGYYPLGNVKYSSLAEIWNNEKMTDLRRKIIHRDIKDLKACSNCDRLWREQIFGIPKEYLWRFLLKKMI